MTEDQIESTSEYYRYYYSIKMSQPDPEEQEMASAS